MTVSLLLALPFTGAINLAKIIMGVLFVVFAVDALINYNRGDLYDGHSHFRKLFTRALVCLVILAGLSALGGAQSSTPVRKGPVTDSVLGSGGNTSFTGGDGYRSGGNGGGGR